MAEAHFNWLQLLPGVTHDNLHVATAIATGGLLLGLAGLGRAALGEGETAVAPASRFSLKAVVESIVEFIVGLTDMVVGHHGRRYVPMFASVFFFVWINNLVGLIPGMTPATDNLNTTLALGIFTFLVYNYYGFKEHGVIAYLKHFAGPVLLLSPLMIVIELIGHMVRPLTLGLRLYGNIMADHTVLSVFIGMFEKFWFIPVPAIFYGMGIFVASMQAFVFTMLTMIYVSMAVAHDH